MTEDTAPNKENPFSSFFSGVKDFFTPSPKPYNIITKEAKPLETEKALMRIFPEDEWKNINRALVVHGQNICSPISPKCSLCKIEEYCGKINVKNTR